MYVANVTDYDNMTDDYNNSLSKNDNCTNSEIGIDTILPTLLFKRPCGLSFLRLMILMIYTLIKPLLGKK